MAPAIKAAPQIRESPKARLIHRPEFMSSHPIAEAKLISIDAPYPLFLCLIVGVLLGIAAIALIGVGVAALASASGMFGLPYPLMVLDWQLPGIFRLHMTFSGLGAIALPCAWLTRGRNVHRAIGRAAFGLLLLGACAAMPCALASPAAPIARLGFFVQGALCILFLVQGLRSIRADNAFRHQRYMAYATAVVFGVVPLRIATFAVARSDLPFDAAYSLMAWMSWLLPLIGVFWWQRQKGFGMPVIDGRWKLVRRHTTPLVEKPPF